MRCRTIQGEGGRHIQEREEGGGREVQHSSDHTHLTEAMIRHFPLITFDGSGVRRTGAGLGIDVWHLLSWQTLPHYSSH